MNGRSAEEVWEERCAIIESALCLHRTRTEPGGQ